MKGSTKTQSAIVNSKPYVIRPARNSRTNRWRAEQNKQSKAFPDTLAVLPR